MADDQLPEGTDTIINGASGSTTDESRSTVSGVADKPESSSAAAPSGDPAPSKDRAASTANGAWFDKIDELKAQGFDSARAYAVTGKDKATTALDDLIQTVNDAAGQIDSKIGTQYGDYARRAVEGLGSFNEGLKGKDVDELFAEARSLVAKAPAVAVGAAAALGFVIARLARSGLPESDPAKSDD